MLCVVICAELLYSMNVLLCYTNLYSTQRKQEFRGGKEHVYLCLWVFMCVCKRDRVREIDKKKSERKKARWSLLPR